MSEPRAGTCRLEYSFEGQQHVVDLGGGRLVLGRSPECDIQLPDVKGVSRQHAVLSAMADGWVVADADSRHGTFVNGHRVTERRLAEGDVLRLGTLHLVFHEGAVPAPLANWSGIDLEAEVPPSASGKARAGAAPSPAARSPVNREEPSPASARSVSPESRPVPPDMDEPRPARSAPRQSPGAQPPRSSDPYHEWLGIPPGRRPASHYALAGVPEFEKDLERIQQSALLRIARLRKHQDDDPARGDVAQRLIGEVSQARACLTDPRQKAEYDRELYRQRGVQTVLMGTRVCPITYGTAMMGGLAIVLVLGAVVGGVIGYRFLPRSWGRASVPLPVAAAPTSKPAAKPAEDVGPEYADVEFSGLPIVFEESFAAPEAEGLCRDHFGDQPMSLREGRWVLPLAPGERRDLYLPPGSGEFGLLVRVHGAELTAEGQSLLLGAYQDLDTYIGTELMGQAGGMAARLRLPGGKTTEPQPVTGTPLWLGLKASGSEWSAHAGREGEPMRVVTEQQATLIPAALGLRAENRSRAPMRIEVDYVRVEGTFSTLPDRARQWPSEPPVPTSEDFEEIIGGRFDLLVGNSARLRYRFLTERELAAWGGQRSADGLGARVSPGLVLPHGPIRDLRQIDFGVRWPDGTASSFDLAFSDGGRIRFDAANNRIELAGGSAAEFPFDSGRSYRCRVERGATGPLSITVDSKRILESEVGHGFDGRLTTELAGSDNIRLSDFSVLGHYDGMGLWLAAVRGEENILTKVAAAPQQVTVTIEYRLPPKGATVLRKDEGSPRPLVTQPGVPVLLEFVNTPENEDHPFVQPGGFLVQFTRGTGETSRLLVAQRDDVAQHFNMEGVLTGLPQSTRQPGLAVTPDLLQVIFATDHAGKGLDLYQAVREEPTEPLARLEAFGPAMGRPGADEMHPFVQPDGRAVYFTRREGNELGVYRASRTRTVDRFGDGQRVVLPANFHHATVTEDGSTMYLQGPMEGGRWGIYRTRRTRNDGPWPEPALLKGIHDSGSLGDQGNLSPCITPDGKLLYFSSTRPGGKGGTDLWVVDVTNLGTELPYSELAALRRKMEQEEEAKRLAEARQQAAAKGWLVLGPFPREQLAGQGPDAFEKLTSPSVLRANPVAGDRHDERAWGYFTPAEPGVYFLSLVFPLDRTADLVLALESAPGGSTFWIDREPVLVAGAAAPWAPVRSAQESAAPKKVLRGIHRLFAVLCVGDPGVPLVVRLLDVQGRNPIEGIRTEFAAGGSR